MRFVPNCKTEIISEKDFSNKINEITKMLNSVKCEGNFTAFDNVNIFYEYFLAEESKANLVIVHGLSEFTKKFYELIYYFLNKGFNVFIYDQRCHGLSERLTPEINLLHVNSFNDYVKDLSYFIDEIVLKTEDKPLYIFSHSMGGAVTALYLAQNQNKIEKAVLSAPMFEPISKQVPFKVARASLNIGKFIFGKKRKFFLSDEFNPNVKFNPAMGQSQARFEHNMKLRIENPNYQSTPMSFGWVSNSLNVGRKILSSSVVKKIQTPILIISATEDKMVNNAPQKKFFEKCKNCRFESVENATHAILASDEAILSKVLNLTFDFLS